MNERIKALADQAGVVYHTRLGAETNTDDLEKFAELIVKECGKFVNRTVDRVEMNEHFGVNDE